MKKIVHDNDIGLNSAPAGFGVRLLVTTHAETGLPSPLGGTILFYSKDKKSSKKGPKSFSMSEKVSVISDQARMEYIYGTC